MVLCVRRHYRELLREGKRTTEKIKKALEINYFNCFIESLCNSVALCGSLCKKALHRVTQRRHREPQRKSKGHGNKLLNNFIESLCNSVALCGSLCKKALHRVTQRRQENQEKIKKALGINH